MRAALVETDSQLVQRLASGELSALGALYERHWQFVFSVLRHRLRSDASAKDVLAEVFLALPKASQRYRDQGQVRGWITGIALKKASEFRRKERFLSAIGRWWGRSAPQVSEPAAAVEARLQTEALLSGLTPPMREVLELRLVHGLEASEIASALGISEKTVWTRIHRARAELRRLTDEGRNQ